MLWWRDPTFWRPMAMAAMLATSLYLFVCYMAAEPPPRHAYLVYSLASAFSLTVTALTRYARSRPDSGAVR